MVNDEKYSKLLDELITRYARENRFLEFKSNYQDAEKLGQYISALSNGACLDREDYGYLFFGVDDETLEIKGTTFDVAKVKAKGNQALELYLRLYITPKIDFKIEEFHYRGKARIVLFRIPAAVGQPTCWFKEPYIRIDSHVTSLTPYTEWLRDIYNSDNDWTAVEVEDATLADLDSEAIAKAREGYKERFPEKAELCDSWDDATFLDHAKLTNNGKITRATILLLGKDGMAPRIGHICQMVWKLLTPTETAGEIFSVPYILSTSRLIGKIRNYRFKIYRDDSLIPVELWKYDEKMLLEALHNCIAHSRYESNARIIVTETEKDLSFWNPGEFYDGSYQDYVFGKKTPKHYRNPFLVTAMVNIKMIDTQGLGIHTLFQRQKNRYLPLPDYDESEPGSVNLLIPGTVLDEDYSLQLIKKTDLTLETVILLDNVQKHKPISADAVKILRKQGLVEGRQPHLIIAKAVAQTIDKEADYSKAKGFSTEFCMDLIEKSVNEHKRLSRPKIDELIVGYLPAVMSDAQKERRIGNILTRMRKEGRIHLGENKMWEPGAAE